MPIKAQNSKRLFYVKTTSHDGQDKANKHEQLLLNTTLVLNCFHLTKSIILFLFETIGVLFI